MYQHVTITSLNDEDQLSFSIQFALASKWIVHACQDVTMDNVNCACQHVTVDNMNCACQHVTMDNVNCACQHVTVDNVNCAC